ncbi:MAG: type II toxin-antitoxin system RelE/ParE family toxin [Solirubrobacterales bacterium]
MPTQGVFYRDERGRQPVREFLWTELTSKEQGLVEDQIDELNGRSDNLPPPPFPQTSQIEGGLRELRCHAGSTLYRILYRRSHNLFVLLHIIRKDSRVVPRRDIELAERRWLAFKQKMENPDRRGPRPAGQDAP